MKATRWIITEVDGRIASVAADYSHFARIAAKIAEGSPKATERIEAHKISTEELVGLSRSISFEDLRLFGSKFQTGVWRTLYDKMKESPRLISYTDLAQMCGNAPGVRAVAHAVAMNPFAWIVPCHLVVPKESITKIGDIRSTAMETTLFKGADLYLLDSIDVGEYAYGPALKRYLIKLHFEINQKP